MLLFLKAGVCFFMHEMSNKVDFYSKREERKREKLKGEASTRNVREN